jgi:hypothetical protein
MTMNWERCPMENNEKVSEVIIEREKNYVLKNEGYRIIYSRVPFSGRQSSLEESHPHWHPSNEIEVQP